MRAYPLQQIAELFLINHDRYKVKLEARSKANPKKSESLYQCADSGMVFSEREPCRNHVIDTQLDNYFDKNETTTEGPRGNFVCVARCGLSGELLGPPNYHGYNQAIQNLWRSRFQHMSFERYLSNIRTVHDEELIEQWKSGLTTKTVYILKPKQEKPTAEEKPADGQPAEAEAPAEAVADEPEAGEETPSEPPEETAEAEETPAEAEAEPVSEPAPAPEISAGGEEFDLKGARTWLEENVAGKFIRKVSRVVIPSEVARNLGDAAVKRRIRDSWTWEQRNHRSLLRALRPALRHMRFHLFKANGGENFVSPVFPKPLDPSQSIEQIKETLEYLRENPGTTREKMVEALRPGHDAGAEEVTEVVQPLRWLIERGHVIEFFDGTL
ncbi:MAG: hypothetical protein AAF492_28190, partial [Verrucomicrobiota bacterium]